MSNPPTAAPSRPVSPLDSVFLYGEAGGMMMHVAALLRFTLPPDAGPDYLTDMIAEIRRDSVVQEPWSRKLKYPRVVPPPLQSWVVDPNFDLDYHFRHSALPHPGGERELGTLVSRLHSNQLDFSRPPWEMHVIEGLEGGRFAIYVKMHHSLVDGYSGMRMLQRSLPADPDATDTPILFAVPPPARTPRPEATPRGLIADVLGTAGGVAQTAVAGATVFEQVGAAAARLALRRGSGRGLVTPVQAPDTILNRRIGRNRRFATQDLDLDLIRRIGHERGVTVNDVCLSVLGGALRRFLSELDELPDAPLIAFVPVNIRPTGDAGGGNAVGAVLASLGTDVADPLERLDAVATSTTAGKAQLQGMSQAAMIAYSLALLSPAAVQGSIAYAGVRSPIPQTFNLIVSNVPGPKERRYFRGSRLEAMYPVSIPVHAAALNVTFMGYSDTLDFGFVGDRDAIPHLQRLAVYSGEALTELAAACG